MRLLSCAARDLSEVGRGASHAQEELALQRESFLRWFLYAEVGPLSGAAVPCPVTFVV